MKKTQPIFFLSAGRSGSYQIFDYFQNSEFVESHHEHLFDETLKSTVSYRMGKLDLSDLKDFFATKYGKSILNCKKDIWIDSSNALPWGLDAMVDCFPNAKFIHLIRDGRKVVSSFFNKFQDEMYPLSGINQLQYWIENYNSTAPDPDKRIWRPIPNIQKDKIAFKEDKSNRFAMLCWYWAELNNEINDFTKDLPPDQFYFLKFENFISNSSERDQLLDFMELDDISILSKDLSKPLNVAKPINFNFSINQSEIFNLICASTNSKFGYDGKREIYDVKY